MSNDCILTFESVQKEQKERWNGKEGGLNEMRAVFRQVEDEGFEKLRMKTWEVHWDHQLFKALDYQYKVGLQNW